MAAERPPLNKDILNKKLADTKKVIREAFEKYPLDKLAASWTGGKDSTLTLTLMREVCKEDGHDLPRIFTIDEGDMFPEIRYMLDTYSKEWDLKLDVLHNADVSRAAGGQLKAPVKVADLDDRNRREIERLGWEEDEFLYEPESYVGNHLMKTVMMNRFIEENGIQGVFVSIRWDEQQARVSETTFSPRPASDLAPAHDRIHPILHFVERDIWDATFMLGLPYCKLYEQGYRSLGARVTTVKAGDVPAWEQDLENTAERGGRRQDKEDIMEKMRSLGYM